MVTVMCMTWDLYEQGCFSLGSHHNTICRFWIHYLNHHWCCSCNWKRCHRLQKCDHTFLVGRCPIACHGDCAKRPQYLIRINALPKLFDQCHDVKPHAFHTDTHGTLFFLLEQLSINESMVILTVLWSSSCASHFCILLSQLGINWGNQGTAFSKMPCGHISIQLYIPSSNRLRFWQVNSRAHVEFYCVQGILSLAHSIKCASDK